MSVGAYFYRRAVLTAGVAEAAPVQFVAGNCFICLQKGPFHFQTLAPKAPIAPLSSADDNFYTISWTASEERFYFSITGRVPTAAYPRTAEGVASAVRAMDAQIDTAIALLSGMYGVNVVGREDYRGTPVQEEGHPIAAEFELRRVIDKLDLDVRTLAQTLGAVQAQSQDDTDRFHKLALMGQLIARASSAMTHEAELVWLWTVLEVYPMLGTRKKHKLDKLLEKIAGERHDRVAKRLRTKNLHEYRSQVLHHGRLVRANEPVEEAVSRLKLIVMAVICELAGLPHSGILDAHPPAPTP